MEDVRGQESLQHALQGDTAAQQQPSSQQQQQGQALSQEQQHQQCNELIAHKDAEIELLQRKLEHYRSWLSSLQGQMQHKDPQIIKNARRLYIGGIPEGTREVGGAQGPMHSSSRGAWTFNTAAFSLRTCLISVMQQVRLDQAVQYRQG